MGDIVHATPQAATAAELRKTRRQLRIALVGAAFGAIAGMAALLVALQAQERAEDAEWRATNAEMRANNAQGIATQARHQLASLRQQLLGQTPPPPTPQPRLFPPVVRKGTVTRTTGEAPVDKGAACRIEVVARPMGDLNCKAKVTCGERVIYGAKRSNGFVLCGVENGEPTVAADDDPSAEHGAVGDPKLDLDLPRGRVVVSDGPDPSFEVVVSLDPRG